MIFGVTILVFLMLCGAIAASVFSDLVSAVIAVAMVSLVASILFYLLQAPDVAMAEAAVGAALTTGLFIIAIKRTRRYEE